jgi:hypothetical protein
MEPSQRGIIFGICFFHAVLKVNPFPNARVLKSLIL